VKLVCRLLCIEGCAVAAGRALLVPAAIMHKCTRIEAKVNKKDHSQAQFWQGLGFDIADDVAAMELDTAKLTSIGIPTAASSTSAGSSSVPTAAAPSARSAATAPGPKKRGRPSKEDARQAAAAVAQQQQQQQAQQQPQQQAQRQRTESPQPEPPKEPPSSPPRRDHPEQVPASSMSREETQTAPPNSLAAILSSSHEQRAPPPMPAQQSSSSAFAPIADADDEGSRNPMDVFIRKTCPGGGEPHLVESDAASYPSGGAEVWHRVPESELECGQYAPPGRTDIRARAPTHDHALPSVLHKM
jgi:hypothetical protein